MISTLIKLSSSVRTNSSIPFAYSFSPIRNAVLELVTTAIPVLRSIAKVEDEKIKTIVSKKRDLK